MLVHPLEMLAPQKIPTESMVANWAFLEAMRAGVASFDREQEMTPAEMLLEITRLSALAPIQPGVAATGGASDDIAHDAYFHVSRIEGEPNTLFVRMALSARLILLQEVDESPVTLSKPLLELIDRSLADLLACLLGGVVDSLPVVGKWIARTDREQVMPRWIRGHQIFAALSQGLIFSFQAMGRATRAGNFAEVRRWADLTISLLRGSGASFVLTGDFSVDDYIRYIRPSMMPPASPICLSGLMSIDHRVLVLAIRDLKPALKSLHERERRRHEQIHEELKTVYDRHIHVCERFVGEKPSLLTAGSTEKSGPALIEQFKTLRLKPFESANHAARLKVEPRAQPIPAAPKCPFPEQLKRSGDSESQS